MFDENGRIDREYHWLNEPDHEVRDRRLHITTSPDTDFWQRTHYGFQRDSGHCLLTTAKTEFSVAVKTEFFPRRQYDQCGLVVRIDSENWIKVSTEYETESYSRLGSVVTNLGYSDWATTDVDSELHAMWYRIQSKNSDFLIECSADGVLWKQLRIAHLHKVFRGLQVGIYACSPTNSTFDAVFDNYSFGKGIWQ
jgi:uncharacterized protein